jgi:hypothetical protein
VQDCVFFYPEIQIYKIDSLPIGCDEYVSSCYLEVNINSQNKIEEITVLV